MIEHKQDYVYPIISFGSVRDLYTLLVEFILEQQSHSLESGEHAHNRV